MVRPILVHSFDKELARELSAALALDLGVGFEEMRNPGAAWDASWGGAEVRVFWLGSEAMLDREFRIACLDRAIVVNALPGAGSHAGDALGLNGRLSAAGVSRIGELLSRELSESHVCVSSRAVGMAEAVKQVKAVVGRSPIAVAADERSYLVEVGRGNLEEALGARELQGPVALYLTDENVERLHGPRLRRAAAATGLRIESLILAPGEQSKCLQTLGSAFDVALGAGIDRSCWVIAAGGGVVTDLSGLMAALWMRGVRWLGIPTTLLSMVDASVGGKTAIDYGRGKNAVGAFWQPSLVVCDVDWLATESERNYIGALSEVVKTAVIGDAGLFELLEQESERVKGRDLDLMVEVVRRCVRVKARIVGLDERESGLRAVLNLGHTVGHALEALGCYERYTHGEAVSLGLVAALRLGKRLGHTDQGVVDRVEGLLGRLGLPVRLPKEELVGASELLGHDKKRAGSALRFVFARGIGEVRSERVMLDEIRDLVLGL